MQVYGYVHLGLEPLDERICVIGQQQVCHILYADIVRAHLNQLLCQLYEVILVMHGAHGVAYGRLAYSAVLLGVFDCGFQISHIVERIEYANDVNAVLDCLAAELLHDVVRIVLIAKYVLTAEKHLQLGVGQGLLQLAETLPRILVQEAQAGVKCSAAPALQRIIANAVQYFAGGEHILCAHTSSGLRLVRIAQYGIGYHQFFSHGAIPPIT